MKKRHFLTLLIAAIFGRWIARREDNRAIFAYLHKIATGIPVGAILPIHTPWPMPCPDGWMRLTSELKSKKEFKELYAAVGGTWGETETHFRIPYELPRGQQGMIQYTSHRRTAEEVAASHELAERLTRLHGGELDGFMSLDEVETRFAACDISPFGGGDETWTFRRGMYPPKILS